MEAVISIVTHYEEYFRREMVQPLPLQSEEAIRVHKKRLSQAEKRIAELDRLFLKIYEDNANGKLSDERYAMMSATYENEQTELKKTARGNQSTGTKDTESRSVHSKGEEIPPSRNSRLTPSGSL